VRNIWPIWRDISTGGSEHKTECRGDVGPWLSRRCSDHFVAACELGHMPREQAELNKHSTYLIMRPTSEATNDRHRENCFQRFWNAG
jgi:hypothetical protein